MSERKRSRAGLDYPGVSCAFVCHDGEGRFVLYRRGSKSRDEQGVWDSGAGELELGETFEEAVAREVREEFGARAQEIRRVGVRNILRGEGSSLTHWVCVLFAVLVDPTEVRIGEPHKIDTLDWFSLDSLPRPLHSQFAAQVDLYRDAGVMLEGVS